MNKKTIYIISACVMLIVAISIAYIFSSKVPSIENIGSQYTDIFPQTNGSISITQTLEPIEDFIPYEPYDKSISKENNENIENLTPPNIVENLTFSAETKKTNLDISEKQNKVTQITEEPRIKQSDKFETKKLEAKIQETKTINPTPIEIKTDKNKQLTINRETIKKEKIKQAQEKKNKTALESTTETKVDPKAETEAETETETETKVEAETEAKVEATQTQKAKEIPTEPHVKKVFITRSSLEPEKDISTIIQSTLTMDGDQVTLLLRGDKPVDSKSFILKKPNRVVFDIRGTWKISIPRVISNRMVKEIRLGKTETHTRLVFDLKVKPSKTTVTQIGPNQTQLTFR